MKLKEAEKYGVHRMVTFILSRFSNRKFIGPTNSMMQVKNIITICSFAFLYNEDASRSISGDNFFRI